MIYILNFDGGFTDSTVSYGFVIKNDLGEVIATDGAKFKEKGSTNVVAEYMGLISGLIECVEMGIKRVKIYGDSQTAIYQINGTYKVRDTNARPLYYVVQQLIQQFDFIEFHWVPREQNGEADRAAKL